MKKSLTIILFICALSSLLRAQLPGQFIITSYERKEAFYFCEGDAMLGGQNIWYGVANLNYTGYNRLDSLRFYGDTSIFQISKWQQRDSVDVGEASLLNVYYVPKQIGTDTIRIVGFYGAYSSTGTIICHAKTAPPIAFYGVMIVSNDVGGGIKIGGSDEVLTIDTLHDVFAYGPYEISDTPQRTGYVDAVYLYTCGTVTIDSIYTVGDFSEIEIQNLPALPYTMNSGDSVKMPYTFTPKVPGKHPHYLVIHTTSGEYLVWSFEYRVLPPSSVKSLPIEFGALHFRPNPTQNMIAIELPGEDAVQSIFIYSASGVPVRSLAFASAERGFQNMQVDVSDLVAGAYTVVVTTAKNILSGRLIKL